MGHNNRLTAANSITPYLVDQPARSDLATAEELRGAVESAGFAIEHWNDLTHRASAVMQAMHLQHNPPARSDCTRSSPTSARKLGNLTRRAGRRTAARRPRRRQSVRPLAAPG